MSFNSRITVLALGAALASTTPSMAEMVAYKADLSGASEVPATTSKGTGTVTATYDTAAKKLTFKGAYANLSGPATAAQFHGPAAVGKNAGVATPITPATSPMDGSVTLTDAQAADLAAGNLYVNVHTAANPNGEIRGQVVKAQ